MTRYVVFDIDGCVSDDRHRRHMLPPKGTTDPKYYDVYNANAKHDKPMNVYALHANLPTHYNALFVTARPAWMRVETEDFIKRELGLGQQDFCLLMRPDGNTQPSPQLKVALLKDLQLLGKVAAAFDDRRDVITAYKAAGIEHAYLLDFTEGKGITCNDWLPDGLAEEVKRTEASDVLADMAATFKERNAVYKDNYKQVPRMLRAMFPNGLPDNLAFEEHFHLLELILVKLTRFGQSGATHVDSIHDVAVYAAMIEAILKEKGE